LPDEDRIIAQRRALAATRDIVDATWRAKVVKNIVPTMGEDLLVDAVEAIDGLGDPADQAEAYCSLVRCATGGRRGEVLEMAWRAAQMSRNAWQRATAFGCIALVTPREMKQRAVKASWEAARASKNISHMADVVSRYPIEFRAGPLRTALNAIDALSDPRERSVPLMILTASIAELLGWTEVLRRLDEIDPGPHRAIALGSALIFAARLPGEAQPIALRNAIDTLRWLDDRARAAGLESLAPWMDSALLARAFDAALEIDDDDARARATAVLLQRAMAESTADVVDLWRVALRRAARRQRSQAFEDMTVLEPILERKGGREAITEAACAILAVMRWFP
jgi:hypothetical protein